MFDLNTNVKSKSGLTADQLNGLVAGHGLAGTGQSFVNGENAHGINALFALAHAIIESAWGDSYFAQNRNNLFGLNAVDSNPNLAYGYPSKGACIDYYFNFLDTEYLTPGGSWYSGGTTIHNVFVHYSSSHDAEGQNIANLMNQLEAKVGAPAEAPATVVTPSGGPVYTVQSGDNLSAIAAAHGLSLARIEQLNPQAGHPAGNFDLIQPGDQINVSGAAPASAPAAAPNYYTVVSGDNLSVIADRHGISLGEIESLNPSAGHPAGNFGNIWPGDQVRVS
jgi:LysM repeat protein